MTEAAAMKPRFIGVGDPAPDLALPLLDGGELRLRDMRGKQVLLYCGASW
ncbi:MAG TPA: hypothetical protein VNM48_12560 [Chloroflexota bacterium]|nr:hypothetical protein [Chloroflexota bacterium]